MLMNLFDNNYICALDISSSKIAASVAKLHKKKISDIFFEEAPSKGIKKGIVFDSIDLVSCLEGVLKRLKAKSGINIRYVYSNISGSEVSLKHSHAIIPLADRGNKVITLSDIEKVNEQARILGSSLEEEIIGQVPFSYSIDSKINVSNPFGLYSHKLEADLYLVSAKLSLVQTLSRAINQAGYEVKDLFFSPFATASAVFDESARDGINILCDIGSDITEMLVFKDSALKSADIIPAGGDALTEQLSLELKIPFELAEEVKRLHASIQDPARVEENKEILIKKENGYTPIKRKVIIESVVSSADKLCSIIKERLESSVCREDVRNFVVCGRNAILEGFLEMLEGKLGIPVKLGRILNPDLQPAINNNHSMSGQKYLTYTTCLGIMSNAMNENIPLIVSVREQDANPVSKLVNKFKEVYQEYF